MGKYVGYFFKNALFSIIYIFLGSMISFAIQIIESTALKILLLALNFALFAFLVGAVSFKEGETSYKVRSANNLERQIIIKTGEDRPLKLAEEYAPYKGFVIGAFAAIPLVILVIVHTVLYFGISENFTVVGAVAGFVYNMFLAPISLITGEFVAWQYFALLYCIPVLMTVTGVPYLLGKRKAQMQKDKIQRLKEEIHGK